MPGFLSYFPHFNYIRGLYMPYTKWRKIDCFYVVELSLTMQYLLSQTNISLFYINRRIINVFRNDRH